MRSVLLATIRQGTGRPPGCADATSGANGAEKLANFATSRAHISTLPLALQAASAHATNSMSGAIAAAHTAGECGSVNVDLLHMLTCGRMSSRFTSKLDQDQAGSNDGVEPHMHSADGHGLCPMAV